MHGLCQGQRLSPYLLHCLLATKAVIMPPSLTESISPAIKIVATASKLAICIIYGVILCLTLPSFSSFAHQIARE